MLVLTQLVTKKSTNEKLMYLGFDDLWKVHFLDKDLNHIITDGEYKIDMKDILGTTDDPIFVNVGTYFGCIDITRLYDQFGKEKIKEFIRQENI